VIAYDVDLKSDSATILYDPKKVSIEELKQAVAQAGFQAKSIEELPK
jgi:copper chaperone CopZ